MTVFANNTSAIVTAGGTGSPSSGSGESWTVSATGYTFPTSLIAGQSFHVVDTASGYTSEKILVTAISGSGPYTWTVVRGDESTATVAHIANFNIQQTVSAGELTNFEQSTVPDYIISVASSVITATATATGTIAYAGSDGGAALSAAISGLAGPGIIAFKSGTYSWSTTPQLPTGLSNWLKIIGNGASIALTTSAYRFLDFNHSPTSGTTFQNIWIDDFHIDVSAITPSNHNHVILGTYINNTFASGTDVNFSRIVVRNIVGTGGVTTTVASGTEQLWIAILAIDTSASENHGATDILIENLDLNGGTFGVGLFGGTSSTSFESNFLWDRITLRNIKHDIGSDPDNTSYLPYAHVQLGSRQLVGTCWIDNIWGRGSRDVGMEIDNALDAHVRNVYMKNVHGNAITVTNFNAPAAVHEQCYFIDDVTLHRDNGVVASNSNSVVGLYANVNQSSVQQAFGRVRCAGLRCYIDGTNMQDIAVGGLGGCLVLLGHTPDEFSVERSVLYAVNLKKTTTGGAFPSAVQAFNPSSGVIKSKVTLRDIDATINGAITGAGTVPVITVFSISSNCDLDMDNCSAGMTWTGGFSGYEVGLQVSSGSLGDSGGTVSGKISRFRVTAMDDSTGYGITLGGTSALTIPGQLVISDCDFSGMTAGGTEVNFEATSNAAKVPVLGKNTWRTMPKAAFSVTAPATTVAAQYLGGLSGILSLTATTNITVLSLSTDGTTYYNVWSTSATTMTAAQARIVTGMYYKATYSGTLTATLLPDS